jgi:pilus assembly protein CpaF
MIHCLEDQFVGKARAILEWLHDPSITDVLINGLYSAFVEREGILERVDPPFQHRDEVNACIERWCLPLGRRVDATRPFFDGRLLDGTRFHLILPPLASYGPCLSLRKRRVGARAPLESFGPKPIVDWVRDRFQGGTSLLISGGTGSGKTTFLSRLLEAVPSDERIVIIEEASEIHIEHSHSIFLEARPPTPDGVGEVTLGALLKNALRMRPTRIVLGECRGAEAWELLQAINSGHAGSASTLHANSPSDALRKLEILVLMAGREVPLRAVREWVSHSVGLVVQLGKQHSNRYIQSIVEVRGLEGDKYRLRPIYEGATTGSG